METRLENLIKNASKILKINKNNLIYALTGAGISAESGIPTFRGKQGLWKKYNPQQLATLEAFLKNPKKVWEWYNLRRKIVLKAKPNLGHLTLAKFEKLFKNFWIITQNIDGLHQKAGAKKVIELHGNIHRAKCLNCGAIFKLDENKFEDVFYCPKCNSILRPDVVWFGENLPEDAIEKSFQISQNASISIVVGTSGTVYPAAYLPLITKRNGGKIIVINDEENPLSEIADIFIKGKAGEILPKILEYYENKV